MSERASSGRFSNERFLARRRRKRRRVLLALLILLLISVGALVWGLRQSIVRISRVTIYGADESLSAVAFAEMRGNYLGVIPRDSTFLLPAESIRGDILALYPDIAALSIFHGGLADLSIKVDYRVPVARWCRAPYVPYAASTTEGCYVFDASGFLYATTSAAAPINSFVLYESLASSSPAIGVTLPNAGKLPAAFDFARQLQAFGSPVSAIVIHDGEVDDYLESGTRITYILGDEQNAFTALTSARANLNLADGSLSYVDLRFGGKLYVKRKE